MNQTSRKIVNVYKNQALKSLSDIFAVAMIVGNKNEELFKRLVDDISQLVVVTDISMDELRTEIIAPAMTANGIPDDFQGLIFNGTSMWKQYQADNDRKLAEEVIK